MHLMLLIVGSPDGKQWAPLPDTRSVVPFTWRNVRRCFTRVVCEAGGITPEEPAHSCRSNVITVLLNYIFKYLLIFYRSYNSFQWAIYSDPVFSKDGGFPKDLLELVAEKSAAQGFPKSRLIDFTEEEKAYIRGTSDFFGVNHYSGALASFSLYTPQAVPSSMDDIGVGQMVPDDWLQSASAWFQVCPF